MVTILMPVYNAEKYVKSAIVSILNQTYRDFEFLILENSSDDRTLEVIREFKDPRIRIHNTQKISLGAALNVGLSEAKSDIIIRMDADDLSHPQRIEKLLECRSQNPEAGVISSNAAYFNERGIIYLLNLPKSDDAIKKMLPIHSPVNHGGSLFEKSLILSAGGFSEDFFEDYQMWLTLRDKTRFYNVQEYIYYIRYNPVSNSRTNLAEKYNLVYKLQEKYYQNFGTSFPGITQEEELIIRGWREYFYGSRHDILKYWQGLPKDSKMILAALAAQLPDVLFLQFKESRLRMRFSYLWRYFTKEKLNLRSTFGSVIRECSK